MAPGEAVDGWPLPRTDLAEVSPGICTSADAIFAIVETASSAGGKSPHDLAPLNNHIDPDGLHGLLATANPGRDGVRFGIEADWDGTSVLLRDDGTVMAYDRDVRPLQLDPWLTTTHAWSSEKSIAWSICSALDIASDRPAARIYESLAESVDPEQLGRVLQPRLDGRNRENARLLLSLCGYEVVVTPDGTIAIEPTLNVLQRSGAWILVVGAVPDRAFDAASATLLNSEPSASVVFAIHGRDRAAADRRIRHAGIAPSQVSVVECPGIVRSTTAVTSSGQAGDDMVVDSVNGGLAAFFDAVNRSIDQPIDRDAPVRVCLDSLESMLIDDDDGIVGRELEGIGDRVRAANGLGQVCLWGDADDPAVEALLPSFDAVLTLRAGQDGTQHRWQLLGTGYETEWVTPG